METGTIEWCLNYAKRHGCTITGEAFRELESLKSQIDDSKKRPKINSPSGEACRKCGGVSAHRMDCEDEIQFA